MLLDVSSSKPASRSIEKSTTIKKCSRKSPGMDAVVSPSLSTTNPPDPRILPLIPDSEFWEECWHCSREEWIFFLPDEQVRSGTTEQKRSGRFKLCYTGQSRWVRRLRRRRCSSKTYESATF